MSNTENEVSPERAKVLAAMSVLGKIKSEKKDEARRRNAVLGGRPRKPLSEIECNCGAGESIDGHRASCLRGQAIARRKAKGQL